jgi:hypothetical protein
MHSSGQQVSWASGEMICPECDFEAEVDWIYDPEFDRYSIGTTCPRCLAEVEKVIE